MSYRVAAVLMVDLMLTIGSSAQCIVVTVQSPQPDQWFGYSVAAVDDLDDDGWNDFIVGIPKSPPQEAGAVAAYSSATGDQLFWRTLSAPGVNRHFGIAVGGGFDITGDDRIDFVVGAPGVDESFNETGRVVAYNSDGGIVWQRSGNLQTRNLGFSVALMPDITGDGLAEVLAGAPRSGIDGHAWVLSGFDGSTIRIHSGGPLSGDFGSSVAWAGDVDADGVADYVVGDRYASESGPGSGRAVVYSGSTGDVIWVLTGNPGDQAGESVAGAGDVNLDGFDDVIVGDVNSFGARVFSGADGLLLFQPGFDDDAGIRVAGGDVNRDGYSDIVLGAGGVHSGREGSVLWKAGGWWSVASSVDLNDDGVVDVVGGMPFGVGAAAVFRGTTPDFDADGDVGPADLATLLANWGACFACIADLSCDDVVNAEDLAVLLASWGTYPMGE